MAKSRSLALAVALLLLVGLLPPLPEGMPMGADTVKLVGAEATIDCGAKCSYRCSKASRHKMCMRACNTCCQRCHCVPPGTSGNQDVCQCYAEMTTHGGRRKCP